MRSIIFKLCLSLGALLDRRLRMIFGAFCFFLLILRIIVAIRAFGADIELPASVTKRHKDSLLYTTPRIEKSLRPPINLIHPRSGFLRSTISSRMSDSAKRNETIFHVRTWRLR